MSRAFVKGDDSDLSGEELPERPISPYPNYVTAHGLAQLRKKYDGLVSHHAELKAAAEDFDKPKLTEIERDLRYFSQRLESAILVDVDNEPRDEVHFGATVKAAIDWTVRHARMRMHTALHLLSAVLPYPVTGGAVKEDDSRLDFDIPEAGLDKDEITAKVNEMIKADAEVRSRWITDEELEANPGLVKTMSVKPPIGTGRVRLIEIVGYDLQPCGGTHVRRTGEIGAVRVTQIEKKGKQNRRVRISFA